MVFGELRRPAPNSAAALRGNPATGERLEYQTGLFEVQLHTMLSGGEPTQLGFVTLIMLGRAAHDAAQLYWGGDSPEADALHQKFLSGVRRVMARMDENDLIRADRLKLATATIPDIAPPPRQSAYDIVLDAARSVPSADLPPPEQHGWQAKLIDAVETKLKLAGHPYKRNTIDKYVRDIVKTPGWDKA